MSLYYVFTQQQVEPLNEFLVLNRNEYPNYTLVIPSQIKNDLYILPYLIFDEPEFSNIKDSVQQYLQGVQVREVTQSEIIETPYFPPIPYPPSGTN